MNVDSYILNLFLICMFYRLLYVILTDQIAYYLAALRDYP
jgi:hypothetical protein